MTIRGIARKTIDSAGGAQLGNQNTTVFVNGYEAIVLNDKVAGHGKPPHSAPVMSTASPNIFIQGIPVCRQGDTASCGHATTGSLNVTANVEK